MPILKQIKAVLLPKKKPGHAALRNADSPLFSGPLVVRSKNANVVLCIIVFLRSYKFHQDRIKIVGQHSFGAKGPKMAFFGVIRSPRALDPPGWSDRKTQT